MVHQVILPGLDHWWGGEVDPVGFTNGFNLVISTSQSDDFGVELGKIFAQLFADFVSSVTFLYFLPFLCLGASTTRGASRAGSQVMNTGVIAFPHVLLTTVVLP